ncbi:hypothetical protein FRC11_001004, partial [Ceratobasidium sp. 423]
PQHSTLSNTPKKLSQLKLDSVLALLDKEKTYAQIYEQTGVSIPSISKIHANHCPDHQNHPAGCPCILNPTATQYAVHLVANGNSVSTCQATQTLSELTGESIHSRTVRRTLKHAGLKPTKTINIRKKCWSSHSLRELWEFHCAAPSSPRAPTSPKKARLRQTRKDPK